MPECRRTTLAISGYELFKKKVKFSPFRRQVCVKRIQINRSLMITVFKNINSKFYRSFGFFFLKFLKIFFSRVKGIKVRMKKSEYLMHHKFAIVDKELLLTGSVNWTMQGFFGNWENVVVSNQPGLVLPFVKEFDRMWTALTKDED